MSTNEGAQEGGLDSMYWDCETDCAETYRSEKTARGLCRTSCYLKYIFRKIS